MDDLINHATALLIDDGLSPHEVGFKLNETLLSALATDQTPGYGRPKDAFKRLKTESADS